MLPLGRVPAAQALLDGGDPARRHAELAHAQIDEPHRSLGVARELPAHADPAAVALGRARRRSRSVRAPAPGPPRAGTRARDCRARPPSCTATGRWCRSRRSPGAGRGDRPGARRPGPRSSRRPRCRSARAARARPGPRRPSRPSGTSRRRGAPVATRRIARSWVGTAPGARARAAVRGGPRNGLSSGSVGDERQRLVGARVERADDQRPAFAGAGRSRSATSTCSSSSGGSVRPR